MPNFKNYIDVCEKAAMDENAFSTFKRNPHFMEILEHTKHDTGISLYKHISSVDSSLVQKENLKKFSSKDMIGSPVYLLSIDDTLISPSTLRYIKVLSDVKKIFSDINSQSSIVEIGAGYGGQSKIFFDYYGINHYDCIDLPQTLNLIKKYMQGYSVNLFSLENIPDKKWDLCISNYAFSECPIHVQETYLSKVIMNSKRGYFTMNFISELFGVTSYSKEKFIDKLASMNLNVEIHEEFPKTHKDNCLITWSANA